MKKSLGELGQGFSNDEEADCSVAGNDDSALTSDDMMAPAGQRRFLRLNPDDLAPALDGGDWGRP